MAERVTVEIVAIDRASGALRKIGGSLRRIAEIAAGILVAQVFGRLARGLKDITRAALEAFEWFDRIRFSLRELAVADLLQQLKDTGQAVGDWDSLFAQASDEAERLLKWVVDLALASPFTAEDVNQMFRLIRAYGFTTDEAQRLSGTILDFAAATGFGAQVLERLGLALGQVRQRGRLAGEEIRQLINTGIPVRDILAKAMNITTTELEKLIRAGKVAADIALPAIFEWMERFNGASERAVQTWHGLLANMKDVKDLNLIALFDGIAKALQPGLQGLFDFLSSEKVMNALRTLGENIGAFLAPKAENILALLSNMDQLLNIISLIRDKTLTPGQGAASILNWLGLIDPGEMQGVRETVDGIASVFESLGEAFDVVTIHWLGPIKDDLPDWIADFAGLEVNPIERIAIAIDAIAASFERASEAGAPFVLESLNEILEGLAEFWDGAGGTAIKDIAEFLLEIVTSGIVGAAVLVAQAISLLVDVLTGDWEGMKRNAVIFTDTMDDLASNVTDTNIFQAAAETLSKAVLLMLGPAALEDFISESGTAVGGAYSDSMAIGIVTGMPGTQQAMLDNLAAVDQEAVAWVDTTGRSSLTRAGQELIDGLGDGMEMEANSLKDRLTRILNDIKAIVRSIFGLRSPSKVFANFGQQMMKGMALGLEAGAGAVGGQLNASLGPFSPQALAGSSSSSRSVVVSVGEINVTAGEGVDGTMIAEKIMNEIGRKVRIATASGSGFIGG